jgi:WS/DGAT/MGAT family acyltransferase
VIENPHDGRTVLLCRLHHCLGDGFALMYVMLGLTDEHPDVPPERELEVAESDPGGWRAALARARDAGRTLLDAARDDPGAVVRRGGDVMVDLARLALLSSQPKDTCLRGPLGRDKRAAWSAPVELEDVKTIGKALGGTVNDVLLAAVAGAMRRYLLDHGEMGFDMRTAVPVNLRRTEAELRRLGNHLGLVFLELPLHEPDARRRFAITKERMDRIKRSPEAFVLWGLMQVVGLSPRWVEELVVALLGSKTTTVVTNVPGPRQPRYLVGQRIDTIMFWVPQTGRVGFGLSIFSYAGRIRLGLAADEHLIPDPERVLDGFGAALEELAAVAGLRD